MTDLAALAPGWELLRDFAVRSAGFPVDGLGAFGPGDEPGRLRAVAGDARFQEAVTWQNPAALANAVLNVAAASPTRPARARQREEVVASYWQRYCAKNDTIGFFGPLAWGRIEDDAPALRMRSGGLVRERAVHLEAWGVQALAETLDPGLQIAAGPHTERELRAALETHADAGVRARGLAALDRLEAARDAVAAAEPDQLRGALAALDATFVELTGREPVRNHGRAYGARTLAYVDCLRDVDVTMGPALVAAMAPALQVVFEAGRWYCGRIAEIGRGVIDDAVAANAHGPFPPLLGAVMPRLMQPAPEVGEQIAGVVVELHRRLAAVIDDADPAGAGARAALAFADHGPAWRHSAFTSVDVQLAARSASAIAAGDFLSVIGDVHPGNNPLVQGVFAHRHPDWPSWSDLSRARIGTGAVLMPPFAPGMGVDARGIPRTPEDDVHIAVMPGTRAQAPRRTWTAGELLVDGQDVVDRSGSLRVPLAEVFGIAIFICGVRAFELLPDREQAPRVTVGRTVLHRASWTVPPRSLPARADDIGAFARDRGMPRRLFAKSPLERKPMYLDLDSPVLRRIVCRHARRAAEEGATEPMRFTEMLPAPEECWLADPDGRRYVSELRLVAAAQPA